MGNKSFNEFADMALSEITKVFAKMNDESVREFLESIKSHDRIFTVGGGREGLATKSFAMRLAHLGKESHWIWDDTTPSIGKGDLLVLPCGAADLGHLNHVIKMAKTAGACCVLITPSPSGFMYDYADIVVKVPAAAYGAKGDFVPSEQLMGNLFEQVLFVLYDVLVMMLREEMKIGVEEMVARHRNVE